MRCIIYLFYLAGSCSRRSLLDLNCLRFVVVRNYDIVFGVNKIGLCVFIVSYYTQKYPFTVTLLKPEQNNVIERVVAKEDVFAFYAFVFGKSLMYLVPPLVSDLVSLHKVFCVC